MNVWSSLMNSFNYLVSALDGSYKHMVVTEKEYLEWKKYYVVDALKGYRLGQSFCEYFGISNASPLYHFRDNIFCERWIKDNYLEK